VSRPVSPAISRVLQGISGGDLTALNAAIRECQAIDERLPDGESALFHAVLSGRIELVEAMLVGGADPNFRAMEPAEDSLAPTPLELAQQARFLMDWERYHPIAVLLQMHAARDREGLTDTPKLLKAMKARARSWQARCTRPDRGMVSGWIQAARRILRRIPPRSPKTGNLP